MTRRGKRKKSGCSKGVFTVLLLLLVTVVLVCTGVLSKLKNHIEKQIFRLEYKQEILLAANTYDFSPEFLCAVIYTESKFKADAQSSAGAMGLMQLMPDTFMEISSRRGESRQESDLLIPEINIDYGAYYLRYLMDTYGYEDIYTACAAYNAGLSNVNEWLKNEEYSYDGKTLHTIPYKETANYVNRIKTAQYMYLRLYFEP